MVGKLKFVAFYTVLAVLGVFNMFSPTIFSGFKLIQPDAGDAVFNAIVLEHVYKSFFDAGYKGTFYTPIYFYPTKLTLTFSDNLLGTAPIYWVARIFFDFLLAFQVWEIVVIVLTFVCYLIFLRKLEISQLPAGVVAFIFSFGTFRVLSTSHPQLFVQFFTPLFWIFFVEFLKKPSTKSFNISMTFLFLQSLSSYYLAWFLIFSLIIFFIVLAYTAKESFIRAFKYLGSIRKYVFVWFLVFAIFWAPYFYTSTRYKDGSGGTEVTERTASVVDYVAFPPGGLYDLADGEYNAKHLAGYGQYLFAGVFGIFVVWGGLQLLKGKRSTNVNLDLAKTFFVTGVVITVLFLQVFNFSFWQLLHEFFPGASAIRFPHRVWLISYFYMFSSFAIYFSAHPPSKKFLGNALLAYFVIEQIIFIHRAYPKNDFVNKSEKIVNVIEGKRCDAMYLDPFEGQSKNFQYILAGMSASIEENVPIINGYSGISTRYLMDKLTEDGLSNVLGPSFSGNLCYIQHDANDSLTLVTMKLVGNPE